MTATRLRTWKYISKKFCVLLLLYVLSLNSGCVWLGFALQRMGLPSEGEPAEERLPLIDCRASLPGYRSACDSSSFVSSDLMLSVSSAMPVCNCPEARALAVLHARRPWLHSTCCLAVSTALLLLFICILAPGWLLLLLLFRFCTCIPLPFWCPPAARSFLRPVRHKLSGASFSPTAPCRISIASAADSRPPETDVGQWGEMCTEIHWFGTFEQWRPTVIYCHGWEPGTSKRRTPNSPRGPRTAPFNFLWLELELTATQTHAQNAEQTSWPERQAREAPPNAHEPVVE